MDISFELPGATRNMVPNKFAIIFASTPGRSRPAWGAKPVSKHRRKPIKEYTMPMTPHGIYNFVEESDFCWVMLFYTTENKSMVDFNQHERLKKHWTQTVSTYRT